MKIVLDTNILVACIHPKSRFHIIWQKFIQREFDLILTTDIILEYSEILPKFYSFEAVNLLLNQFNLQSNVKLINRYYEWKLITIDPDDNKFVDCAIASGCDYLVTNDKHFNILDQIEFPKVHVINDEAFLKLLVRS